jgi:methylenetetrahydrofolate reductase (NADH)
MSLKDVWTGRTKPTVSMEFFPPRTEKAAGKLQKILPDLVSLQPDFMSVTFGAGGSTRDGSRQLVAQLKQISDIEIVAYLACYGLDPAVIKDILGAYRDLNVETILCIRGDEPKEDNAITPHPDSLPYATHLISFVNDTFDFCLGVAGYPEGHVESETIESDLEFLKHKVDAGAHYIISQFFYDNQYFYDFVDRCRAAGISVPILAGIMPVYSISMLKNLTNFCGATVPGELQMQLDAIPPDDKKAVSRLGIEYATQQCRDLLRHGVDGLHIYTMNRGKAATGIITTLRSENLL